MTRQKFLCHSQNFMVMCYFFTPEYLSKQHSDIQCHCKHGSQYAILFEECELACLV